MVKAKVQVSHLRYLHTDAGCGPEDIGERELLHRNVNMGCRVDIDLTNQELMQAGVNGVMRHIKSKRQNHSNRLNETERDLNSWSIDINGVCGEMAVSRYLGKYYLPPEIREEDVAGGLEVRTTTYETGHLVIRPNDKPAIYILVVAKTFRFSIRGWMHSDDVRVPKYFQPPDNIGAGYWKVPQSALRDIAELKNGIA